MNRIFISIEGFTPISVLGSQDTPHLFKIRMLVARSCLFILELIIIIGLLHGVTFGTAVNVSSQVDLVIFSLIVPFF